MHLSFLWAAGSSAMAPEISFASDTAGKEIDDSIGRVNGRPSTCMVTSHMADG
jgi:hypothetical protein